jgi:hypothetical protein
MKASDTFIIYLFISFLIPPSYYLLHNFLFDPICLFVYLFIYLFISWAIYVFIDLLIYLFMYLFIIYLYID